MIEKLNDPINGNTEPMHMIIDLTKSMKANKERVNVAEIGIGWGATAVELIKILGEKDTYYYFDFDDNVRELYEDLVGINKNHVNIMGIGNSRLKYDSYAWNLAKLYLQWKEEYGNGQQLDVIYLDGAHTFLFDSAAACIAKEMLSEGGVIVLDDINWKIANSPTCNPEVNPEILNCYTDEQINSCRIKMVQECFFDNDERFERMGNYNRIAVFKRIQ